MWATLLILAVGGGALIVSFALAALAGRRARWLGWQTAIGVLVAVVAWKVASSSGAFDDSEECSDCGEAQFWGLVLLAGNIVGWVVGSAVGFGLARRRR